MKKITTILLFIFVALYFYRPVETEDIGLHIATGRWISEHQQIPRINIFPLADEQTPWIWTQWLGSLTFFKVYDAADIQGLKIFRSVLFLLILLMFYFFARKRIPSVMLLALVFVLTFAVETRALLRPIIFNLIFIQIFLSILFAYQQRQSKTIYWLPLLTVIWFNTHLGCLFYGVSLVGLFFVSLRTKKMFWIFIGCLFAMMLNPYGLEGVIYPLQVMIPTVGAEQLGRTFAEYLPPLYILTRKGLWFYVLLGGVIASFFYNRKNNFTHIILFVFALFFFLYGARSSGLFIFTSAYIIAQSCANINLIKQWGDYSLSKMLDRLFLTCLIIVLCFNLVHLFQRKLIVGDAAQTYLSLKYDPYNVVNAVGFLNQNQIKGNVFCWPMYSGYLLWKSYPDLKLFVDSRDKDLPTMNEYYLVSLFPEKYWPNVEEKYNLTIAILEANAGFQSKIIKYLNVSDQWRLAFLEGSSMVFLKHDAVMLPNYLEDQLKDVKYDKQQGQEALAKVQKRKANFILNYLNPSPEYNRFQTEAVNLFFFGYVDAAMDKMRQALLVEPTTRMKEIFEILEGERDRLQGSN